MTKNMFINCTRHQLNDGTYLSERYLNWNPISSRGIWPICLEKLDSYNRNILHAESISYTSINNILFIQPKVMVVTRNITYTYKYCVFIKYE